MAVPSVNVVSRFISKFRHWPGSAVRANHPTIPRQCGTGKSSRKTKTTIGNDCGCIRQYYLSTLAGQRGKRKSFDNTKSYKILKNTTDDGSSIRQCCLSIHFKIQTLARQRGEGKSSNNTTTVRYRQIFPQNQNTTKLETTADASVNIIFRHWPGSAVRENHSTIPSLTKY